jgi:NhaP-type Na+/H+ or K+/H+ antiporter
MGTTILTVGLIIFLAHFFVALFEKVKIPDVLLLMIIGLILGPITGLVKPDFFGRAGEIATTVALIVILFESGIKLKFKEIKEGIGPTTIIAGLTLIATTFIVAGLFKLCTGCQFIVALIAGSIVGGTSSAVVIPMIKSLNIDEKTYTILFFESAITDALCIVIVFSFIKTYKLGEMNFFGIIKGILLTLVVASIIGGVGALVWSLILKYIRRIPDNIFTSFAFIFIIYGITEWIGFSGAIASLAFGITLANVKKVREKAREVSEKNKDKPEKEVIPIHRKVYLTEFSRVEKTFFSEVVFLLKVFFFIYLGLSIKLTGINTILLGLVFTLVIYIARHIIVFIFSPRDITPRDAGYLSSLIPKGLAAAVLASIPVVEKIPYAEFIRNLTYSIVFFSILISSILIPLIEKTGYERLFNHLFFYLRKKDKEKRRILPM